MNRSIPINRTNHPFWTRYDPDGRGRDSYISLNNGGFWKDAEPPKYKPSYPYFKNYNYHSLSHMAAPFKYTPDGSGRDLYVIVDPGLRHDFRPLTTYNLQGFIRGGGDNVAVNLKPHYMGVKEKTINKQIKDLEKRLALRLYEPGKEKIRKIRAMTEEKKNVEKGIEEEKISVKRINTNYAKEGTEMSLAALAEGGPIPFLREYPNEFNTVIPNNPLLKTSINYYRGYNPMPVLPKPRYYRKKKKLEINDVGNFNA